MPENKDEWIVIAQGEDGLITHRNDDFEPVMNQIDRYVNAIHGYQLDLDWKTNLRPRDSLACENPDRNRRPVARPRAHTVPQRLSGTAALGVKMMQQ